MRRDNSSVHPSDSSIKQNAFPADHLSCSKSSVASSVSSTFNVIDVLSEDCRTLLHHHQIQLVMCPVKYTQPCTEVCPLSQQSALASPWPWWASHLFTGHHTGRNICDVDRCLWWIYVVLRYFSCILTQGFGISTSVLELANSWPLSQAVSPHKTCKKKEAQFLWWRESSFQHYPVHLTVCSVHQWW